MTTTPLNPTVDAIQFINQQTTTFAGSRYLSGRLYVSYALVRGDLVSYEVHWGNNRNQKLGGNSLIVEYGLKKYGNESDNSYVYTRPLTFDFAETPVPRLATCLLVFVRDRNSQEYLYARRALIDTQHLLPPNASPLERQMAMVAARISQIPVNIATLYNESLCPDELLPWLGWSVSADIWFDDASDPITQARRRRELIRTSAFVHKHKGTRAAVQQVLNSFTNASVTLTEWWQQNPPAAPHTFRLDLLVNDNDPGLGSAEFDRRLRQAIDAVKPVRSHYYFTVSTVQNSTMKFASATQAVSYKCFHMAATL